MDDENFDEEYHSEPQSEPQSDKPDTKIYVGPSSLQLRIGRYELYKNGLPQYVHDAIELIPELEKLIIPVDELNQFMHKLEEPSSAERIYFKRVQEKIKEMTK